MKRNPMTLRGADALRAELRRLKSEARPAVIKAIAEARGHGDLSENAEYHAAREQQSFIEGRIAEIEGKLATAEIIDVRAVGASGRVVFGATVVVKDLDFGDEEIFILVGAGEEDYDLGKILVTSPLAQGLLGKKKGEKVEIFVPKGTMSFEILEIRFEG